MNSKRSHYILVIVAACAISLLVIFLSQYYAYKEASALIENQFNNQQMSVSKLTALRVEDDIKLLEKELQLLSMKTAVRNINVRGSRESLEEVFSRVRDLYVNDLALLDSKGTVRLPLRASQLTGADFSFREYFRKASILKDSVPIYEFIEFKGVDSGEKGIVIAMPLFKDSGAFNGVVLFTIKISELIEGFIPSGESSSDYWIIDNSGNILYKSLADKDSRKLCSTSESFREFLERSKASKGYIARCVSPEGDVFITTSYPLNIADQLCLFVISSPVKLISGVLNHMALQYIVTTVIIFIAMSGILFFIIYLINGWNIALKDEITERKLAKESLKESEAKYRNLFEHSLVGISISKGNNVIAANKAVLDIFGYDRREFLKLPLLDHVAPESQEFIREKMERRARGEQLDSRYEYKIIRKDGEIRDIEISTGTIDIENETYVQGTFRDITERKQAEEERRESSNRYMKLSQEFNTLLNAIPDSISLMSPELKIMWANNSSSLRAGMKSNEMTGNHCYELFHSRHTPCDDCPTLKTFRTGKASTFLDSISDGRFSEIRTYPIKDPDGEVQSVIKIIIDVTEKMSLQADTIRTGHLALIGELAAGVAHEINNPLNSIINYAQVIINESDSKSIENDISGQIKEEGKRITTIVKSLLSFARGGSEEERKTVHMLQLTLDTLSLIQASMRKNGIDLKIDIPSDLPEVHVNPQQIQQVFLNIMNNAQYALNQRYPDAHDNKKLHINGEEVTGNGRRLVRIAFHDHGTGISKDIVDKIMNPFFSTKPSGHGTGLGLSISHGIVKDHGGKLSIDSTEGEYACVTIDIPAAEKI
jgi:PAS domain S-box-containing protein